MTAMPEPILDSWLKTWESLSKLTGIRRLHITLAFRWHNFDYEELWKQKGISLLEPVKKITAPRDFVVVLPNRRCSTCVDAGESNCVFKLPDRNDETDDGTA